jgi:hypothetical protein
MTESAGRYTLASYGYIRPSAARGPDGGHAVDACVEEPDAATAAPSRHGADGGRRGGPSDLRPRLRELAAEAFARHLFVSCPAISLMNQRPAEHFVKKIAASVQTLAASCRSTL